MYWICNGEPKNKHYFNRTSFPHKPVKNTENFCIRCGLPKEAMDSKERASRDSASKSKKELLAGRFKILNFLAKGGFGETYVAEDIHRFNSKCFIKQLKPANRDSFALETARRLFLSEAESLNELGNHAQIPQLLAYFEQKYEFYLVQEFIEGNPINKELVSGKRWQQEQVVHLLQEVLDVLSFIHERGVIHRDIKPHNLIRRKNNNQLVLVDFGAVKQVRVDLNISTVVIGTQGYAAPEQLRGRPNFSSDLYSLGLVGIQALTGILPQQLHEDGGEFIWQQYAQVDEQLGYILTKMTKFDFHERYQSATEVLDSLKSLSFFESAQYTNRPTVISSPSKAKFSSNNNVSQVNVTSLGENTVASRFFATGTIRQSNFFENQTIRYQKINETLKFYVEHLDREYKTLSKQADMTYKLWVFCVVLGILILVAAVIMTFVGMLTQGIITAVSTGIVFFIQRIFQQREDYYRKQISIKNKHLEYGNQWLLTIQTIDAISDPVEKEKRQARLVEVLTSKLGLSEQPETQSS